MFIKTVIAAKFPLSLLGNEWRLHIKYLLVFNMASVQVGNRKIRLPKSFTPEEVKTAVADFERIILPLFESTKPSAEKIKEMKLEGWMVAILRAKGLLT